MMSKRKHADAEFDCHFDTTLSTSNKINLNSEKNENNQDTLTENDEKNRILCSNTMTPILPIDGVSVVGIKNSPTDINKYIERDSVFIDEFTNILWDKKSKLTYSNMYRIIENYLIMRPWNKIYTTLETEIIHYLKESSKKAIQMLILDSDNVIKFVNDFWDDYKKKKLILELRATTCSNPMRRIPDRSVMGHVEIIMRLICMVFSYMDRTFVIHQGNKLSLNNLYNKLFRDHFLCEPKTLEAFITTIIIKIEEDRKNEIEPSSDCLLYNLVNIFIEHKIYEEVFESRYLENSEKYISDCADNLRKNMKDDSLENYIDNVNKMLNVENNRIDAYLYYTTRKPILDMIKTKYLNVDILGVLNLGLPYLMQENCVSVLCNLFKLLSPLEDGLYNLIQVFTSYVNDTAHTFLFNDEKREIVNDKLVFCVLEFKEKIEMIIEKSFNNHKAFNDSLKSEFKKLFNVKPSRVAQLVVIYIDLKFKECAQNDDISDFELKKKNVIHDCLCLFRYLNAKDVFETFYKSALSKRLLTLRNSMYDLEKQMLLRFREECGSQFTTQLEKMFEDLEISYKISKLYNDVNRSTHVNFKVLTSEAWPKFYDLSVKCIPEMIEIQNKLKELYYQYDTKNKNKKLHWRTNLGFCLIAVNFKNGPIEILASELQTTILMLFQHRDEMEYTSIKNYTKLDDIEIKKTLHTLMFQKYNLLIKLNSNDSTNITKTDVFQFNINFTNENKRIKLNFAKLNDLSNVERNVKEKIQKDRKYNIDAAIIRIMKIKRSLPEETLQKKIYTIINFPINKTDFSKRIDSLISRDYIKKDNNIVHYVA
ncbi:hypothetical protein A3Q56_02518 [Intoshia linei]|uniref:Cullin family profile domain-containing protein n=1 Tax=Intoshia linei TaxID=1819745 RepID=A0A177B615_9BILA|nr:hypothetical protein A3Q56_02518 [Intoshia linei]